MPVQDNTAEAKQTEIDRLRRELEEAQDKKFDKLLPFINAVKMEYIPTHPMEKLVVSRTERYEATFYNKDELNTLFEVFKGDRLELVVHIAAYYGLRRSEVLGLRWDAVDFKNKTISIQRKVVSDYDENGQRKLFVETRLKTNSTRRTLPLIPHIEKMLLEKQELEAHFKKICGSSYDKEFEGVICGDNYGKLISPEYVTSRFHYFITKAGLRHLRFYDLRQSKTTAETAEPAPEKKSTRKRSASKKSTAKTTDTPAPKKTGGRKKKSDIPTAKSESQTLRL